MAEFIHGLLGLSTLLLLAWTMSEDRWRVPIRVVLSGVLLQFGMALLLLKFPPSAQLLLWVKAGVDAVESATQSGTAFVFGYLGGGPAPFAEIRPENSYVLAFRALPMVLVVSALATLLFHWGILQRVTGGFAWILRRSIGIGGPLGLGAAVHIFVGMVEAPLLIRPYLKDMGRGELFALMSCGMAGIAGTVMVIYASLIGPLVPNALGNILVASVISTPAALAVAALMVPFCPAVGKGEVEGQLVLHDPPVGTLDAIAKGTSDGILILINIVAMLVVLLALVSLVNSGLGLLPHWGEEVVTLQRLFGWLFYPVMALIGIPREEIATAAHLMGTKTVVNEFVAYVDFSRLPPDALSPRSRLILTYALCGFANFGSLGIMLGGLTAMAPERKHEIAGLGLRSILSGTIATCMSGAVAGML
jgi:concentrative nucleoside transporter, CNT family